MKYRKLSPTGDYMFGNGELDFWHDVPEAPGQAAKTRLLLWLGEWFLDTTQGTPYMQGILGKHLQELADATIQDRVLNTQGVTSIENYESEVDPDSRTMIVSMTLNTIYGVTEVQLENYVNY